MTSNTIEQHPSKSAGKATLNTNTRRQARIRSYQTIFQRLLLGVQIHSEQYLIDRSGLKSGNLAYSQQLTDTAWKNIDFLEKTINPPDNKEHYLIALRALMLTACAELIWFKETPAKAVINEWVEICKQYVGKHHKVYCNGVLDRILKSGEFRSE